MNKMIIPKFLRALTWVSIPVFVLALAGWASLYNANPETLPDWLRASSLALLSGMEILAGVSFILMLTAYNFSLLFDWALSGLLRRFGKPATATIIARHNTGILVGRWAHIWRIELRVHPVGKEEFHAITEDMGSGGSEGTKVSVRYDPLTKAVAILRPWEK